MPLPRTKLFPHRIMCRHTEVSLVSSEQAALPRAVLAPWQSVHECSRHKKKRVWHASYRRFQMHVRRARGVVVSHPLSMREARGSIPSASSHCQCGLDRHHWCVHMCGTMHGVYAHTSIAAGSTGVRTHGRQREELMRHHCVMRALMHCPSLACPHHVTAAQACKPAAWTCRALS